MHQDFLEKNKFIKKSMIVSHFNACMLGKLKDLQRKDLHHNNSFTDISILDNISYRKYKTLSLNKRLREHRLFLLALLADDGYIEDNNISFDLDLSLFRDFDSLILHNIENKEQLTDFSLIKKLKTGYTKLYKIYKKTIDYDNIDLVEGIGYETKKIYEESYFSLVTETLFFNKSEFVSEKSFKPIVHFHPFVIVGSPYTLQYLKEYGFKTFSDVWDESYDTELDSNKRFIKVWNLSKSLIEKSHDEWVEIYNKIKPILIHNRNVIENFSKNDTTETLIMRNLKNLILDENSSKDNKLF